MKIVSLLFHKYSSTFGENIGLYFVNISVNTWLDTFRANHNMGGGSRGFCPLQRDLADINVLKIMSLLFHKYSSTFGENIGLYFVNISVNTWLDTFRANHNIRAFKGSAKVKLSGQE